MKRSQLKEEKAINFSKDNFMFKAITLVMNEGPGSYIFARTTPAHKVILKYANLQKAKIFLWTPIYL